MSSNILSKLRHRSAQAPAGWWRWPAAWLLLPLLLGACRQAPAPAQTLTIFAAASLTDAFQELAATFAARQAGVDVRLNLGGSQQLAQQLVQGAPADLFASADTHQMAVAVESGRIAASAPRTFAGNRLVLIAPPNNPAAVHSLLDLARPGIKLVLAAEAVPAGRYARAILAEAATREPYGPSFMKATLANVVSYEQNVRAVLTKVTLGEADAGVVYASDVQGTELTVVEIPPDLNVRARYLLALVADSAQPEVARAFIRFVLSPAGQKILVAHGFQPPAAP